MLYAQSAAPPTAYNGGDGAPGDAGPGDGSVRRGPAAAGGRRGRPSLAGDPANTSALLRAWPPAEVAGWLPRPNNRENPEDWGSFRRGGLTLGGGKVGILLSEFRFSK